MISIIKLYVNILVTTFLSFLFKCNEITQIKTRFCPIIEYDNELKQGVCLFKNETTSITKIRPCTKGMYCDLTEGENISYCKQILETYLNYNSTIYDTFGLINKQSDLIEYDYCDSGSNLECSSQICKDNYCKGLQNGKICTSLNDCDSNNFCKIKIKANNFYEVNDVNNNGNENNNDEFGYCTQRKEEGDFCEHDIQCVNTHGCFRNKCIRLHSIKTNNILFSNIQENERKFCYSNYIGPENYCENTQLIIDNNFTTCITNKDCLYNTQATNKSINFAYSKSSISKCICGNDGNNYCKYGSDSEQYANYRASKMKLLTYDCPYLTRYSCKLISIDDKEIYLKAKNNLLYRPRPQLNISEEINNDYKDDFINSLDSLKIIQLCSPNEVFNYGCIKCSSINNCETCSMKLNFLVCNQCERGYYLDSLRNRCSKLQRCNQNDIPLCDYCLTNLCMTCVLQAEKVNETSCACKYGFHRVDNYCEKGIASYTTPNKDEEQKIKEINNNNGVEKVTLVKIGNIILICYIVFFIGIVFILFCYSFLKSIRYMYCKNCNAFSTKVDYGYLYTCMNDCNLCQKCISEIVSKRKEKCISCSKYIMQIGLKIPINDSEEKMKSKLSKNKVLVKKDKNVSNISDDLVMTSNINSLSKIDSEVGDSSIGSKRTLTSYEEIELKVVDSLNEVEESKIDILEDKDSNIKTKKINESANEIGASKLSKSKLNSDENSNCCLICYEISEINYFTCYNSHMVCTKCRDEMRIAKNDCCPFCRDKTLFQGGYTY